MRNYEMMIILDPTLEERIVQPSLEQYLQVVPSGGGAVEKLEIWGRRRLAYEIDKRSEGIYAVVDLLAEPDTVRELDRQLNLNEAVLRTKVVRPQAHRPGHAPLLITPQDHGNDREQPDGSRRHPDYDRGQPR